MTEKVLAFDHGIIPQEKGWDCGPAATQVVLNAVGIVVTETQLIAEIGTTTNGTDDVSWIENRCLDKRLPEANYTTVYLRSDPPSPAQIDTYWRNLTQSIDTGHGVINNWVSPPSNAPRGIKGAQSPIGYGGHTVYHYVAAVGYDDNFDGRGGRAVCIADSGFRPFFYWVTLEQCVGLITPKGYCYANTGSAAPPPAPVMSTLPRADRYALLIIQEGRRLNITPRGIKIALAVGLVETNLTNYANSNDPASLLLPHDAVGSDHLSSGWAQQQPPWGPLADRMDITRAATLFFTVDNGPGVRGLTKIRDGQTGVLYDYNDTSRTPGFYAQKVQGSAFPDRYDTRYADAEQLYTRLINLAAPLDPLEELLMSEIEVESLSPYAIPGESKVKLIERFKLMDAMMHSRLVVEEDAKLADTDALNRLLMCAAGKGNFTDPATLAHAAAVLADRAAQNPSVLTFLATKAATGDATARAIVLRIEANNPAVIQAALTTQKGA